MRIDLHQALHGYSDGHRLLSSSMPLERSMERQLALTTDLSGPGITEGFRSYLTGYPLNNEYYAFSRTWDAPEMPRPGCVWTHTLFLDLEVLSTLQHPAQLLSLFRRPTLGDFESYGKRCESSEMEHPPIPALSIEARAAFMNTLGGLFSPQRVTPQILCADTSQEFEQVILEIWGLQWPELQQGFRFCTGFLGNRLPQGLHYDVMLVPSLVRNRFKREYSCEHFPDLDPESACAPQVDLALRLPRGPETNTLRRNVAELLKAKRGEFFSVVFMVDKIERGEFDTIFEELVESFDPSKLKNTLLKLPELTANAITHTQILVAIANSQSLTAEQTSELLRDSPAMGISGTPVLLGGILAKETLTPSSREVVRHFAEALEDEQFREFSPEALARLAKIEPSLGQRKTFWESSPSAAPLLLKELALSTPQQSSRIIEAAADASVHGVVATACQILETKDLARLLERALESHVNEVTRDWARYLSSHVDKGMDLLESSNSSKIYSFLAHTLDPNNRQIRRLGAGPWMGSEFAKVLADDSAGAANTAAFLLTVALGNPEGAEPLAAMAFEMVHDALASEKLSNRSWRHLAFHLPGVPWWDRWDKCEQLRRAVLEAARNGSWIEGELLGSLRESTLKALLSTEPKARSSKRYFSAVASHSQDGSLVRVLLRWLENS